LDLAKADWDFVVDVNLRGTFFGAREAARQMIACGNGGTIVNVGSTAGYRASGPGVAHYVASKHGVRGLTKSLAKELGPEGIRALAVAPVYTTTPGTDEQAAEWEAAGLRGVVDLQVQRVPLGRLNVADDVARVVLFCVCDLSMMMTGTTLVVDGGDLVH
jgi:NAD(P)-dependent dehydrogenase (short-subunit alcohol dehydrogenase family)